MAKFRITNTNDNSVELALENTVLANVKQGEFIAKTVSSVANLMSTPTVGVLNVLNYHSDIEGGGGVFYWDSNKLKSEHNGGTIIDPNKVFPSAWNDQVQLTNWFTGSNTGSGCWVRQYNGAINVKWFGAKGDGITNDFVALTSAHKNSTSIFYPNSDAFYCTTDPIVVYSNSTIKGESRDKAIVRNISFYNEPGREGYSYETTSPFTFAVAPNSTKTDVLTTDNYSSFGTRVAVIGGYNSGSMRKLAVADSSGFSIGDIVIVESTVSGTSIPDYSFVDEIVEVFSDNHISLKRGYPGSISSATVRNLSSSNLSLVRNIHIQDLCMAASYYVGDGQFGVVGNIGNSYECSIVNCKVVGGICLSSNFVNHMVLEGNEIYCEYTGIELALLSSGGIIRNNNVILHAGYVTDTFASTGASTPSIGIQLAEGQNNCLVEGNKITGKFNTGIYNKSITRFNTIRNNTIQGFYYFGVRFDQYHDRARVEGNIITSYESFSYGLTSEPNTTVQVINNDISVLNYPIVFNMAILEMYPNKLHSFGGFPLVGGKYADNTTPSLSVGQYIKDFGFNLLPDITYGNPASVTLTEGLVLQSFTLPGNSISPLASNICWEFTIQYGNDLSRTTNINIGSYTYTVNTTRAIVKIKITGTNYQDTGTV
jgi:parallel beta-helix repeat protein